VGVPKKRWRRCAEAFSLVVSDVNMPGMDGHQLLGQLRRAAATAGVADDRARAVERAVDAMRQGAADYLVKPFEPKALLSLVERHAAGRGETTGRWPASRPAAIAGAGGAGRAQ
jgi:DNA-binding NtrC family response regulator